MRGDGRVKQVLIAVQRLQEAPGGVSVAVVAGMLHAAVNDPAGRVALLVLAEFILAALSGIVIDPENLRDG